MSDMPYGLYEKLIDVSVVKALSTVFGQDWDRCASLRDLESDTMDEERRRHLLHLLSKELGLALDELSIQDRAKAQVELILSLLRALRTTEDRTPVRPLQLLTRLTPDAEGADSEPMTGLLQSWLFTAGKHDPSLLDELRRELSAVDHVDILVSFITWSGVRKLIDLFDRATAAGADGQPKTRFRILTTTYIGATEAKAVEWLAAKPGIDVRISLDGRRTRLHAKAWIFRRNTGYGSAYIGSANLSGAALTGGLEWTLKVTQAADTPVFDKAVAHFETLWNDPEFVPFDPESDEQRKALRTALARESGRPESQDDLETPQVFFNLEPKSYQNELLERLAAERRHNRTRNLLVAATGTGKTVISAFDYQRTCKQVGGMPRLLFVAHRKEILQQARTTFGQVLREPGFGDICADGREPATYDHLFCTIQSFRSRSLAQRFGPEHWHTLIVDECHHLAADSYQALAELTPTILLGLTATPERADGKRLDFFFDQRLDGSPAAELRLWEALDQQILAPFEYYACEDGTDLSDIPWDQAGETAALDRLLTGNDLRANTAINALLRYVSKPDKIRCLAFCVSVAHAQFMSGALNRAGIKSEVIVGDTAVTPVDLRRKAPGRLARGEVNVLCTCDLYNEGIDIPSVDTLLFLRPTQSPVIIQQQLGRGLRLAPDKDSCLIIDLVGRHKSDFRFDRMFGILSGLPRTQLISAVEHGFSSLPPGCHIQLDKLTREQVLRGLQELTMSSWRHLAKELQGYSILPGKQNADLAEFLRDTGIELSDLYRGNGPRGWTALRRKVGLENRPLGTHEEAICSKLGNLLPQDDPALLSTLSLVAEEQAEYGTSGAAEACRIDAMSAELFPAPRDPCPGKDLGSRLSDCPAVREELKQLSGLIEDTNTHTAIPLPECPSAWPFHLHCSYSLRTIALFSGKTAPDSRHLPREGVIRFPDEKIEIMLVTFDKTTGFKASTSYHDYAISPELFHWQTQNSAGPDTEAGRRYIEGKDSGWTFQLFVRENKDHLYRAIGPVQYEQHEGGRPMSITWRLQVPLPAGLFKRYSVLRES